MEAEARAAADVLSKHGLCSSSSCFSSGAIGWQQQQKQLATLPRIRRFMYPLVSVVRVHTSKANGRAADEGTKQRSSSSARRSS